MNRTCAGALLALLATGCAVGDSVELRIDQKAPPKEAGVEFLVLTTPAGKELDNQLRAIAGQGATAQHTAIGQLFAEQGPLDTGPLRSSYRFVLIGRSERSPVVVHVSPDDGDQRALWIVASYANTTPNDAKRMLRVDSENRHHHFVRVFAQGIALADREPGS